MSKNSLCEMSYMSIYEMYFRQLCKISSRFANPTYFRRLKVIWPRCLECFHKTSLINPIWTGGADLAPPVRFFFLAPEVVMEGLWNLVTFPKIYLRRFSKKFFLVTMDWLAMTTKLSKGSQDKKSIYFF